MRFVGFLRVQILVMRFVNLAVHQGEEQPDTELFLQVVPFIYYATCWSGEEKVENCGWERRGER